MEQKKKGIQSEQKSVLFSIMIIKLVFTKLPC